MLLRELISECAQAAKAGAGGGGVAGERGDGHETMEGQMVGQVRKMFEQRGQFGRFRFEAFLGGLAAQFELDENWEGAVEFAGACMEALGNSQRVDGVDGGEELGGAGGFIRLQVPDEVYGKRFLRRRIAGKAGNVDVCPSECGRLAGELLDPVFAEETLSGLGGFEQSLNGMLLGNRHEPDFVARAIGHSAGGGDLFFYLFEALPDRV